MNMFPYNAGVQLYNLPYMKQTNTDFINWILSQHNGLYFGCEQGGLTWCWGVLHGTPSEGHCTISIL